MATSISEIRPDADAAEGQIYCLLPSSVGMRTERALRVYAEANDVVLISDRRRTDRRSAADRRQAAWPCGGSVRVARADARRIINRDGRRVADRRATMIPVPAPAPLPRRLAAIQPGLAFAEALTQSRQHVEDIDTARLVTRIQAGETGLFSEIYTRYFDRIYGYLRLALNDGHEAEDATQQIFLQALEALETYELRGAPFRAWLFRIVRNYSINHAMKHRRVDIEDPGEIDRRREVKCDTELPPEALEWLTDQDLMVLVSRLPLAQRQVILLRYMMDLSCPEIAEVLGRTPDAVRQLQQRALNFLRVRLSALGRGPEPEHHHVRLAMRRRHGLSPTLRMRRYGRFAAAVA